jgi:DNA-binding transcriptional ArsR family regulator
MVNPMVQHAPASLDAVFAALSDPTRRALVERLTTGEASVTELSEPFAMTLTAVAKHLRVLSDAGIVEHRKEGRVRTCKLAAGPLLEAHAWLGEYGRFWEGQFDSLAAHLGGPAQD